MIFRFDLFFILVDDCNEVTDYAIARRIIDLHTKLEESVERLYSEEEVLAAFLSGVLKDFACLVLSGVAVSTVCEDVQA